MNSKTIVLVAMTAALAVRAHAQNGTTSLLDLGTPSFSPGTDVSQGTTFTIGNLYEPGNNTGIFAGSPSLPAEDFGTLTFTTSTPDTFSFGNAAFGTFIGSSIVTLDSSPNHGIEFLVLGTYTSGTWDGGAITSESSSVDYTFTQNGAGLSDSGVLSIPAVPEPGSLALLAAGTTALCVHLRRRKA